MFGLPKPNQFNVNDQDAASSSVLDGFNEDDSLSSFDSADPFGSYASSWSPSAVGSDARGATSSAFDNGGSLQSDWGSGAAFARSPASPLAGADQTASASAVSSQTSATSDSGGTTVSTSGSGLVFDNTYLASCTAAFEACIVAAEKQLESLFTNSDTIVVSFQEQSSPGSGDALSNTNNGILVSYATLKAALLKAAPSDVLPSADPSGGKNWYVPYSYARMLGLTTTTGSPDLTVTLNTADTGLDDLGQDVINGLTHELSEGGLGRIGGLGGSGTGSWSTMDLFRYNASGDPDYTNGRDGDVTYFSNNGGATLSNQNNPNKGAPTLSYNNQYNSSGTQANKGDTADWTQTQVFGATAGGETLTLDQTELDVMEALGWNLSLKQDVFDEALGGWETPTNWSTGSMPITPQDAYIGGVSGDMVVTLNSNVTVNSIATSADAEFAIGNGTASKLIAIDGTVLNSEDASSVASGNLGGIGVEPGSSLQIGNTFDNAGTLAIGKGAGGSGDSAELYVYDTLGAVTLDGGGALDLGQLANASDDEIRTFGDILNAPGTSGNGLINVDNTITGGGVIQLGSFDNQADGKVEASQAGGYALKINAGTFSNEGFLTAESGATLDLGGDGASETLTNTGNGTTGGAVDIDGGARLAISGNFTVAGSGDMAFKGAGADMTSDGTGATTLTNESTIALEASLSSSGAFSGQIGDQGVLGVNDLTFVNDGTTFAEGAGYTLTVNTGANTVTNGSGGTLEAVSGAILALDSNVNNQGTIGAGTSSSSSSGATTGTVDLGEDGGTGSMTNTGTVAIQAGGDLAIRGNYTISGSGLVGFKGAGGEITSDGSAAATFINESSIDATFSGQIGDKGLEGSNDLTFENLGTVGASGSGVKLTLNTGGNTIDDGGGTLEAESGATLAIDSNVDTGEINLIVGHPPPGGTIEAASGGTVILSAGVANGVALASVPGQVVIDGGIFEMLAGSSVSVPIEFTGNPAGTLELFSTSSTVDASGSNGVVDLTSAQASVDGGADTFHFESGTGNVATISGTAGVWDIVNGSNGAIDLMSAQTSVFGGADVITFSGSGDAVSLYDTASVFDRVNGSSGLIALNSAQTSVFGGGDTIYFNGAGDAASLYETTSAWDTVNGSSGLVALNSAQAAVFGGADTIYLNGSGDAASLYDTTSGWDVVNGSSGLIALNSAQTSVFGGADTVYLNGSGDAASLYDTASVWDTVSGSSGLIALNSAQTSVFGGGDTLFLNGSGDAASLYDTASVWDSVNGSSGLIALNSAQAAVSGGGDSLFFNGAGDAASLDDTGSAADTVNGSSSDIALTGAEATIVGSSDSLFLSGTSEATLNGGSDLMAFQASIGLATINGFAASDELQFSKTDFANFTAFMKDVSQSGANTLIKLDASDEVTLTNFTASKLTSAHVTFV
jgi:hypothetical protein